MLLERNRMRHVVITGSARGIGYEIAREFLRLGLCVTVSSVNADSLANAKERLVEYGDRVQFVRCDVRNRDEVKALWQVAEQHWGGVDVWINNAGISQPRQKLWELSGDTTEAIVCTNILGVIYGSQIAAEGMIRQGHGFIYNMEGLGSDGRIVDKTGLYGMTKWNLVYFTKALARELRGTPVRVGRLLPGMMPTDFITKPTLGEQSRVVDEQTRKIFNILGDKPDTVARYLAARILSNRSANSHIKWLTAGRVMGRFLLAPFRKRNIFDQ